MKTIYIGLKRIMTNMFAFKFRTMEIIGTVGKVTVYNQSHIFNFHPTPPPVITTMIIIPLITPTSTLFIPWRDKLVLGGADMPEV